MKQIRNNNIWFTSDLHQQIDHARIIEYENRSFETVQEQKEKLLQLWNETVKPKDIVYYLGDLAFQWKNAIEFLENCNGKVFYIVGNHDHQWINKLRRKINEDKKLRKKVIGVWDILTTKIEEKQMCLCHYPIESWPHKHYNSVHLHGHCHGNLNNFIFNRLDVSLDKWGKLLTFEEVLYYINIINTGIITDELIFKKGV